MELIPSSTLERFNFAQPRDYDKVTTLCLVPIQEQYEQTYLLTRIKLKPIEITKKSRDSILRALNLNKNHVQLGEITIMLNSISGIEPIKKRPRPDNLIPYTWEQGDDKYK